MPWPRHHRCGYRPAHASGLRRHHGDHRQSGEKGAKGDPGELKGDFSVQRDVGTVTVNSSGGIFGTVADPDFLSGGTPVPVAAAGQITTGPATILATVSGSDVREYRVELVRLYGADEPTRNLLLRITDPALLSATGGIVQGMSGSPSSRTAASSARSPTSCSTTPPAATAYSLRICSTWPADRPGGEGREALPVRPFL